jgi:thiamine biosynthesis lipoprotein
MATSGVARRRWHQGTQVRHHLLDPRTGLPALNGLWSVSVVAARCIQAEVAAKVAFILGSEAGAEFLRARGLAGMLVLESGEAHTVGAWPAPMGVMR